MGDKLYFYSKSRDVYPGSGTNEVARDPSVYLELSSIPRWRQVLSNFSDDCTLPYKGRTYRTIEHAFQATKIAQADDAAAALFSLESESDLSRESGADAQSKRKMRQLDKNQLSRWEIDQADLLRQLWRYKSVHSPLFRAVLLATGDAQLWHVQNRKPAVRWKDLEVIRAEFR